MSETIWTPLRYDIKDDNADPPVSGDDPKWCEGTAYFYPTEPGVTDDEKQKARPLTLTAYNQINQVRNAIVSESPRLEWTADAPFTAGEIQAFKRDIEEWQSAYNWQIPSGDEEFFHKYDINDLRRLATYPYLEYEQDVRSSFPLLHDWCIDYTTKGMRVFVETGEDATCGDWESYVDTQIAPAGQSHRFWIWTRYPEYSDWFNASAGVIGVDGVMKPPIAGYSEGWTETPNSGGDGANWWLIQLVQDMHSPLEELTTAKKALKGLQHWMAYSWWSLTHCEQTCGEGGKTKWWTYYYDDCQDRVTEGYREGGICHSTDPECWCLYNPDGCTKDYFYEGSYPEEDEDLETGGEFFHTWEYYMDQL